MRCGLAERDEADIPIALPGPCFEPIDREPFVLGFGDPLELLAIFIIRAEEEFSCPADLLHEMTHATGFYRDFGEVERFAVQMQQIAKF